MGGIAFRAPVLASLFLIVSLATLAIPGSANFVGEFLILLGVFNAKLVIAIIAFSGVVLASVYALRLFITAMHNRVGPSVRLARDLRCATALVLVPLIAVVLFLALYPQLALHRSEGSVKARSRRSRARPGSAAYALAPVHTVTDAGGPSLSATITPEARAMSLLLATAHLRGPHIDFAGAVAADRAAGRARWWCCCVGHARLALRAAHARAGCSAW